MTAKRAKRAIDVVVGVVGSVVTAPLLLVLIAVAAVDTRSSGIFRQARVGRGGELFEIVKISTMRPVSGVDTNITVENDPRITAIGARLRGWKLDELPQLWNVARGYMSLVGPRPDVPGYADELSGADRRILELRPGITGPASVVFRNEERLLAGQGDPARYNDTMIWPAKVALNRAYADHASLGDDARLLLMTLRPSVPALVDLLDRWDPTLVDEPAIAAALDVERAG